jgi:hypothetical protein
MSTGFLGGGVVDIESVGDRPGVDHGQDRVGLVHFGALSRLFGICQHHSGLPYRIGYRFDFHRLIQAGGTDSFSRQNRPDPFPISLANVLLEAGLSHLSERLEVVRAAGTPSGPPRS